MDFLRRIVKVFLVAWVFASSILEVIIKRPRSRAGRAAWLQQICRRLMKAGKVTLEVEGTVPMLGAVISNHLSYTDILSHAAVRPCVFVSKAELRKTPVFGWVSMMAGTVYVSRGSGGSAAKAAEGMGKGFRDGLPVVFFPEGTTGVGEAQVMEFRSGLLAQAIASEQPVTPAFIRYTLSPRDVAAGKTTANTVHWGQQTLLQHIWAFFGLHGLHAVITFAGQPIAFTPAAVANRKIAAVEARHAVLSLIPGAQAPDRITA